MTAQARPTSCKTELYIIIIHTFVTAAISTCKTDLHACIMHTFVTTASL